jgi:hypothetical protein
MLSTLLLSLLLPLLLLLHCCLCRLPDRIARRMNGAAPFTIIPESVSWDGQGMPIVEVS